VFSKTRLIFEGFLCVYFKNEPALQAKIMNVSTMVHNEKRYWVPMRETNHSGAAGCRIQQASTRGGNNLGDFWQTASMVMKYLNPDDYIPRAHDAGRERGRIGEFFESLKSKVQGPKLERLLVAGWQGSTDG
jgi:hypothetical protein